LNVGLEEPGRNLVASENCREKLTPRGMQHLCRGQGGRHYVHRRVSGRPAALVKLQEGPSRRVYEGRRARGSARKARQQELCSSRYERREEFSIAPDKGSYLRPSSTGQDDSERVGDRSRSVVSRGFRDALQRKRRGLRN
jgi:ABC-type ATPase with predicted acetyltransferase domain